jgi:hypothetical protein
MNDIAYVINLTRWQILYGEGNRNKEGLDKNVEMASGYFDRLN